MSFARAREQFETGFIDYESFMLLVDIIIDENCDDEEYINHIREELDEMF